MKKISFSIVFITLVLFYACDKEDTLPIRFTPIPGSNVSVKFYHISPDAPNVNIFVNGIKSTSIAPNASNVVQGIAFGQLYPATTAYTTLPSGSLQFQAKVPDSSAITPGAIISTTTENLQAGKFYTYVLVDSLSKLSTVVVEDDPNIALANKAYFRIANFIPNGAVKVEIVKTSTGFTYSNTFDNVPFKAVQSYDTLSAGAGEVYRIFLRNPATNAKLDSITAFTPAASKKYTFYCRGVFGQTGTSAKRPLIFSTINF